MHPSTLFLLLFAIHSSLATCSDAQGNQIRCPEDAVTNIGTTNGQDSSYDGRQTQTVYQDPSRSAPYDPNGSTSSQGGHSPTERARTDHRNKPNRRRPSNFTVTQAYSPHPTAPVYGQAYDPYGRPGRWQPVPQPTVEPLTENEDICDTNHIDAIEVIGQSTLVFVDQYLFNLTSGYKMRNRLQLIFPFLNESVKSIDATLRVNNELWLFHGQTIYKVDLSRLPLPQPSEYEEVRVPMTSLLELGLPFHIGRVRMAFAWQQIGLTRYFLFGDQMYWELTSSGGQLRASQSLPTSSHWKNMPWNVDTALVHNNELYFFAKKTLYNTKHSNEVELTKSNESVLSLITRLWPSRMCM